MIIEQGGPSPPRGENLYSKKHTKTLHKIPTVLGILQNIYYIPVYRQPRQKFQGKTLREL